jgi:hypothetical protein
MMLSFRVETCESILRGLPVIAGNLDPVVLRHALRGRPLPGGDTYLHITDGMLDAVAEAESILTRRAT